MSRSHSPNGTHMRYECDGCDARVSSPEGVAPQGWLVEFTRDLCPGCRVPEGRRLGAQARGRPNTWDPPRQAQPDPRWLAGPRVRVDSMATGAKFIAYDGRVYTVVGREKAGAFFVMSESGAETCFAGCADGVLV